MQKGSHHSKGPKKDLIGQQFGHLTVDKMIQIDVGPHKCWGVHCNCDCGKQYQTHLLYALHNGTIASCGCGRERHRKTAGKENVKFTGHEGISGSMWRDLKDRAERREYKVEITIQDAWFLFEKQDKKCALSNIPLIFGRRDYPKETTASLDRIDSARGYVLDNVQWVHKSINVMKNTLDQKMFINLCRRIARTQIIVPEMTDQEITDGYVSRAYISNIKTQKREAQQRRKNKEKNDD